MRITVNGDAVGEHTQTTGDAELTDLALPLRAGENVVAFEYRIPPTEPPPDNLAFLFRDLELTTGP